MHTGAEMMALLDGAYKCTAASTSGGSVVDFNADWSLEFGCLSVLSMYRAKGQECSVVGLMKSVGLIRKWRPQFSLGWSIW